MLFRSLCRYVLNMCRDVHNICRVIQVCHPNMFRAHRYLLWTDINMCSHVYALCRDVLNMCRDVHNICRVIQVRPRDLPICFWHIDISYGQISTCVVMYMPYGTTVSLMDMSMTYAGMSKVAEIGGGQYRNIHSGPFPIW